ncbi:MAG: histidine phosphatase family protein [Spirosomaceae bacterium]|nr:histidine phosphatase family protein [Spirosomataceae bacterium]
MHHKTIYLIRHGETDFNRRGVVQGSGIDAHLNDLGRAQAQAFFETYQHVDFDKIYTSKLIRTVQSVEGFLDKGHAHEAHEGLNEISWGVREGRTPNSMDSDYYRWLIESWQNGQTDLPAEGGESPEDVQKRLLPVVELILARPEEKTVLVAMHGRAMRVLLATILGQPLAKMDDYPHHNVCLYLLHYDYDTSSFSIVKENDLTHLQSL